MKIIQPSFNEIYIRIYPWIMLIVGLIFIAVGSVFTVGFNLSYSINCQEKSPGIARGCQLKTTALNLYLSQSSLGDLKKAKISSWRNNKGTRRYRVKLVGSNQSIRIGGFANISRHTAQTVAQKINHFIQYRNDPKLPIGRLTSTWLILFGLLFPVIGFCVAITAKKIQLQINKSDNKLTLTRRNIFGTKELTIPLNEIKSIDLESSRGNKGQTVYRVAIVKLNGERTPIQTSFDNLYQQKMTLIAKLNEFLMLEKSPSITTVEKQIDKQNKLAKTFFVIGLVFFLGIGGFILFSQ